MRKNSAGYHLSRTAARLLALIVQEPVQISYHDIAARLEVDRDTAITAVKRLKLEHRLVVELGRGGKANRYRALPPRDPALPNTLPNE